MGDRYFAQVDWASWSNPGPMAHGMRVPQLSTLSAIPWAWTMQHCKGAEDCRSSWVAGKLGPVFGRDAMKNLTPFQIWKEMFKNNIWSCFPREQRDFPSDLRDFEFSQWPKLAIARWGLGGTYNKFGQVVQQSVLLVTSQPRKNHSGHYRARPWALATAPWQATYRDGDKAEGLDVPTPRKKAAIWSNGACWQNQCYSSSLDLPFAIPL